MDNLDRIRDFNRFYTRHMALFSNDYVDSGLSVTEIRILREITEGQHSQAREIATSLEIDEGYLSRVVRKFVQKGWLKQARAETDARRKHLQATAEGMAVFKDLRDRTRADITDRFASRDIVSIANTMDQLKLICTQVEHGNVDIRDLLPGDIGWLTQRHGELYVTEFGYDERFERFAGEILFEFQRNFTPETHRAFIACHGQTRLGSVFYEPGDQPGWAKLRVFFVEPSARGAGIGQKLMDDCLTCARAAGYTQIELYTLENLTTARRMYARNGFECVERTPQRFCGRDTAEERWTRAL